MSWLNDAEEEKRRKDVAEETQQIARRDAVQKYWDDNRNELFVLLSDVRSHVMVREKLSDSRKRTFLGTFRSGEDLAYDIIETYEPGAYSEQYKQIIKCTFRFAVRKIDRQYLSNEPRYTVDTVFSIETGTSHDPLGTCLKIRQLSQSLDTQVRDMVHLKSLLAQIVLDWKGRTPSSNWPD